MGARAGKWTVVSRRRQWSMRSPAGSQDRPGEPPKRLLLRHHVLDDADDGHQHDAAHTTTGHAAEHAGTRTDGSPATHHGTENLPTDAAAQYAGNAVDQGAQAEVLEEDPTQVLAYRTKYRFLSMAIDFSYWRQPAAAGSRSSQYSK